MAGEAFPRTHVAKFYGKLALPALVPAEGGENSDKRWLPNPAFHRIDTRPTRGPKLQFPFASRASVRVASLAEGAKQPPSNMQAQKPLAAVPSANCMEELDLTSLIKDHVHPEADGASEAAEQQVSDKV